MLRYGQFCPVAKAAEVFADRWTPLILRELCFKACTFGELLFALPLISRTMLAQRLKEMADAEIISITPKAQGRGNLYQMTPTGEEFRPLLQLLSVWGQRWIRAIAPDELDPALLMFGANRQIDPADIPDGRTVVQFEFRGVPKGKDKQRYWWLLIRRPETEVCIKHPGFDVDAVISADLGAFTSVFLGRVGLRNALAERSIAFSGSKTAIDLTCRLFQLPDEPMQKRFHLGPALAPHDRPPMAMAAVPVHNDFITATNVVPA